jgi:hypothetical protein
MKYLDILNIVRNKTVELRHDVDISIDSAYSMAKFEYDNGISSIYYLRFDSDYYNLLTVNNRKIVDYLLKNHEVGCHVDCSDFETNDQLYEYLYFYNKIIPFSKFTFHINTEKTKSFGEVKYFENKSILTNEYISDSKNEFSLEKLDRLKNSDNYTLVIHPEWWIHNNFVFCDDGYNALISSLKLEELKKQALKEILKYE